MKKKIIIEDATFTASQQVADEIDKKFDETYEDITCKRSAFSSLYRTRGVRFESSNRGLLEEIQKASEQFEKVFSIWGLAHFTRSSCIQEKLTELKIPFAVLIPNKEKREQAAIDFGYADDKFERAFLRVYTPDGDCTKYVLPNDVVQFFHAPIQTLFSVKREMKVYLPEELAESLDDEHRFITENGRKIALAKVHLDFFSLIERYYVENRPLDEEFGELFSRNLNNWLLFSKLCAKKIKVKNISAICRDFDVCVTVKCDESFVWTFHKNTAMSNPDFLFSEMKKRCITHYTIENDEALFLETDSAETAQKLASDSSCFCSWLEKYVPVGMRLKLSGRYVVGQVKKRESK